MVETVGNQVQALKRTRIGQFELGELRRGEARRLESGEVAALWKDSAP
jgi:16S rRNA U516 pseudouridylate synthase RsuA-like enzyme